MRSDPDASFVNPLLLAALAIWREKAAGRAMPLRSDMTPRALKAILPHLAIYDALREAGAMRFRNRVTGEAIVRVFGSAPGRYIDEVVRSPFRERWEAMMQLPLDVGAPVRITRRVEFKNQTYLRVEDFWAPMGPAREAPDSILFVAHFEPCVANDAASSTPSDYAGTAFQK